jgi:predicted alpha/beta superfamily hydrolase
MSPALGWDNRHLLRRYERDAGWMKQTKFWIDMGTAESKDPGETERHLQNLRALEWTLTEVGLRQDKDFKVVVEDGGEHNEKSWARRLEPALKFLFPP